MDLIVYFFPSPLSAFTVLCLGVYFSLTGG